MAVPISGEGSVVGTSNGKSVNPITICRRGIALFIFPVLLAVAIVMLRGASRAQVR